MLAIEYPGHYQVRFVCNAGTLRFKSRLLSIANALKQHYIGLEEVEDSIWPICFCRVTPCPRTQGGLLSQLSSILPVRAVTDPPGCSEPVPAPTAHVLFPRSNTSLITHVSARLSADVHSVTGLCVALRAIVLSSVSAGRPA